ncbi:NAD-dependent epimerase/dehydratase family protein [Microbacterium sp. NPDC089320]|uniref:NAD-dependent epimerase/dehydratase family protein n=1 Tax=Microbacterium sp. NPDC089320 TaxID=3155182 RepID=UPI003412ECAB
MSVPAASTVLVTGGGGRLGRLVVGALRSRGTRALSLARKQVSNCSDDLVADLGDPDAVNDAVRGAAIDVIVHLAAVVHGDEVVAANRRLDLGLRSLIRAAEPSAIVFASSSAVYGDRQREALTEESPALGDSPYAVSKRATEDLLRLECARRASLSVTTLRIFNIAGPDFPDSLVHRLIAADPTRPVSLRPLDSFVRDYIHQADVVRSILAAHERARPGYRTLNVGAGVPISTRQLLRSLDVSDDSWIEIDGPVSSSWADIAAAVRCLGVRPVAVPSPDWAGNDPAGVRQSLR